MHELCHLRIKGHSHHFWHLLRKYLPDYQDRINWLEINGKNMVSSLIKLKYNILWNNEKVKTYYLFVLIDIWTNLSSRKILSQERLKTLII